MVTIVAITATAGTIGFTIAPLYRLQTVGLDPLQLVLVGSAMEATVFVAEVPTGIVADAVSRRLSVIIGHGGIGVAFVLEASWPTFTGVVTAQVLWGLAYTFTLGAITAWLAAELGEPDTGASRDCSSASAGSGRSPRSWPCRARGCWPGGRCGRRCSSPVRSSFLLTVWLVVAMGEARFRPAPQPERSTWGHLVDIGRAGVQAMWSGRVLLWFAVFAVVVGGASEAYDRLYEAQLLGPVGMPTWFGWSPLVWFGLLTTVSAVLGIVVPPLVERRRPAETAARHTRWLLALTALQIAGLLVFGLAGAFLVAAVASLVVERARSVRDTLLASYLVPLTPPETRATVLSAFGQADAIGQVAIGPAFGLIGRLVSLPAALVASALATAPGLPIIAAAGRATRARRRTGGGRPGVGSRA